MVSGTIPALVIGQVSHVRRTPKRHSVRHRLYQWLVDVDELPRLPRWLRPLASFRTRDHLGDPSSTLAANIRALLTEHGVDASGDRILMLAAARSLGHVFNPLSVYWVIDRRSHTVRCVVAEVHNTYGERHAYVLFPDEKGRAEVEKDFYVSPFYDLQGRYEVRCRIGPTTVTTTITLHREGEPPFSAGFHGTLHPYTPGELLRTALTHPLMTWRVSVLIRVHGIVLWLKGLPIVPRPSRDHESHQEVVS